MKSSGVSKEDIKTAVSSLLELKKQLGAVLGVDPATIGAPAKGSKKK